MVQYPVRAVRALGYLKAPFNDVEIYVEDTTCHNMHLFIYRRILGPQIRLKSVNQVGDRQRVLAACAADQNDDGRKKLYIVDGDFDGLLGRRTARLKFFYRLQTYDIENVLISEDAILAVGMGARPNDTEALIATELNFNNWWPNIASVFLPLFIVYAAVHKVDASIQTVGLSVHLLCNTANNEMAPAQDKIRARIKSLLREIRARGQWDDYVEARKIISNRVRRATVKLKFVSGKRYLFPILANRMRRVLRVRGGDDQVKTQLAMQYVISAERGLYRAVRSLAN